MANKYEFVSWKQCYDLCLELYRRVSHSGYQFDVVVGVARGGWVPARILADLFITHQTANVKVEFYRGIYETDEQPRISQPVSSEARWKRLLVVDDISDTGQSLKATVTHLKSFKAAEIRTVCLHAKPWTKLMPDFYVNLTEAWVVYPWELKEFVFTFANQLSHDQVAQETIKKQLMKLGLPNPYTQSFFEHWQTTKAD